MHLVKNNSFRFTQDEPPIIFDGPYVLSQFRIDSLEGNTDTDDKTTTFKVSIGVSRMFMNQILTIFTPIVLLWLLAYSTLLIDVDGFGDRFRGTVTVLLCLTMIRKLISYVFQLYDYSLSLSFSLYTHTQSLSLSLSLSLPLSLWCIQ